MTDAPKAPQAPQRTLADLRKSAGLTQAQVAKSMGISRVQVSRIEAQFPNVSFVTLHAYLRAIGEDVVFSGAGGDTLADNVVADPARREAVERRRASMNTL